MLGYDPVTERAQRDGVEFWCTDIEENVSLMRVT